MNFDFQIVQCLRETNREKMLFKEWDGGIERDYLGCMFAERDSGLFDDYLNYYNGDLTIGRLREDDRDILQELKKDNFAYENRTLL